jgi:hypothetical protein
MKNWIALISLLFSFSSDFCQTPMYHLDYREKTSRIRDFDFNVHSVTLFRPMVEYRVFEDEKIAQDILYNGFNSRYIERPVYYSRQDSLEKVISNLTQAKILRKISRYVPYSYGHLGVQDSIQVSKELKKIKVGLKSESKKEYAISDSLYNILKIHGNDNQLFMTVTFLQIDRHLPRVTNNWALYTIYVFDLRTKTISFYNYVQNLAHTYETTFEFSRSQKRFIRILRPYIRFLRKNKRRLKKEKTK